MDALQLPHPLDKKTMAFDTAHISSLPHKDASSRVASFCFIHHRLNKTVFSFSFTCKNFRDSQSLKLVVHPLNYNFVFAKNDAVFESSLGAKIVADYTKSFGKLNFKSNLSSCTNFSTDAVTYSILRTLCA